MTNKPTKVSHVDTIINILDTIIPPTRNIFLFDFPNHANVGDSAIWLGEERYLNARFPDAKIQVASITDCEKQLPTLHANTTILIHGGGNLGDLWPQQQNFRERLVTFYVKHRIIQLPQSIYFENPKNEERFQKILGTHANFHLLARDHVSYTKAKRLYDCEVHLCPDSALLLEPLRRSCRPTNNITALLRQDHERNRSRTDGVATNPTIQKVDWLDDKPTFAMQISRWPKRYPNWVRFPPAVRRMVYKKLASERLNRGCEILSAGEVVITDRLHAHILCCLMEIPHVVLDNSYGKISSFIETWNTGTGLRHTAETLDDATEIAMSLTRLSGS